MRPIVDIIYNMTFVYPHNCAGCCVDAAHVTRQGNDVVVRTQGLGVEERFAREDRTKSIYDIAARRFQESGRELSFEQKLAVIRNLDVEGVRLDVSGG
jgi:hypothetical protein